MNIEEGVKEIEKIKEMFIHLKNYGWINDIKKEIDVDKAIESIETLLTAYEKEKEKNKELIKERATEIVYVDKNFVRKDKIKAKIEEYYEYDKRMQNKPDWHTTKYYEAKALEKLLEE